MNTLSMQEMLPLMETVMTRAYLTFPHVLRSDMICSTLEFYPVLRCVQSADHNKSKPGV